MYKKCPAEFTIPSRSSEAPEARRLEGERTSGGSGILTMAFRHVKVIADDTVSARFFIGFDMVPKHITIPHSCSKI